LDAIDVLLPSHFCQSYGPAYGLLAGQGLAILEAVKRLFHNYSAGHRIVLPHEPSFQVPQWQFGSAQNLPEFAYVLKTSGFT
jgi:hypothetical protein